jgi:hypothetical protein
MSAWQRVFLAIFLLSTLALGWAGMGRSLWLDEAWVANSILAPTLREMFIYPDWLQTSPPLFLLLSRGAVRIAGLSNTVFRIVPLGLALVASGAMFGLSRRVLSLPWAVLATSLVVFHPAFIEYSHSGKQYSGEVAATVMVLLVTVRYLQRPTRWGYFLLVAVVVLGLTLAYPVVFLLPGLLVCGRFQDESGPAAGLQAGMPAPHLLTVAAAVTMLVLWAFFIRPNTAPELRVFWAADADSLFTPGLIGAALFVLLLSVWILTHARGTRQWIQLLCAIPCLLLAIASVAGWYPATQRMRLWALPCFVLLCLMSAEDLMRNTRIGRVLPLALAFVFVAVNVRSQIHDHRDQTEEDFAGAFAYLKSHAGQTDLLLVHAAAREGFLLYSKIQGWNGPPPVYGDTGWPCCARGKNALPGRSSEASVIADINAMIPPGFGGRIWLFYPTRPSHWRYTGLNEGDLWRKLVWEKHCPPGPYMAFKNLAVSPMECTALSSTALR